jgi:SP family sugar:H+ symporter-like MFS transporter
MNLMRSIGTNGRRTLIAVGVQVLQQSSGNSFTTTYLVIFLQQVGVTKPYLINVANYCCSLAGTFLAFYLTDKLGRRPMLIGGAFFMCALLWIISGIATWAPNGGRDAAGAQGCIAAILLFVSLTILLRFYSPLMLP